MGMAPRLAGHLSRHVSLFEAMLAPDFFEPLPEGATTYSSGWLSYILVFYPLSQEVSYHCTGEAYFELEKSGGEWKITLWRDRKAGEGLTWGWLKAMYRYPPS